MKLNKTAAVLSATAVVSLGAGVALAGGAASAKGLITGHDIATGAVTSKHIADGTIRPRDLSDSALQSLQAGPKGDKGATGARGPQGEAGTDGKNGAAGIVGAYYSVAKYNAGDTNAGAIATVACEHPTDVAIAGGVQTLGLDEGANARNTPVSSSFPGRMDWATNAPKADRLDGWIVQFGGNAGESSDKAPEKANVWALCLPGGDIPVHTTFSQVD